MRTQSCEKSGAWLIKSDQTPLQATNQSTFSFPFLHHFNTIILWTVDQVLDKAGLHPRFGTLDRATPRQDRPAGRHFRVHCMLRVYWVTQPEWCLSQRGFAMLLMNRQNWSSRSNVRGNPWLSISHCGLHVWFGTWLHSDMWGSNMVKMLHIEAAKIHLSCHAPPGCDVEYAKQL